MLLSIVKHIELNCADQKVPNWTLAWTHLIISVGRAFWIIIDFNGSWLQSSDPYWICVNVQVLTRQRQFTQENRANEQHDVTHEKPYWRKLTWLCWTVAQHKRKENEVNLTAFPDETSSPVLSIQSKYPSFKPKNIDTILLMCNV